MARDARGDRRDLQDTRTRDEWCAQLEGSDACFAPVLSIDEAPQHPHAKARGAFVEIDGVVQPAPAPRFSRSAVGQPGAVPETGAHTDEVLADAGFSPAEIDALRGAGTEPAV